MKGWAWLSLQSRQVLELFREKPQYVHVTIGFAVMVFFAYLQYQILEGPVIVSIMIFHLLSVLFTFPLRGPLWCKIIWLGLGSFVGLSWNLVWSSLASVTAGMGTSEITYGVIGPAIDFVWMVPVWSLGLSALASAEHHKKERK